MENVFKISKSYLNAPLLTYKYVAFTAHSLLLTSVNKSDTPPSTLGVIIIYTQAQVGDNLLNDGSLLME